MNNLDFEKINTMLILQQDLKDLAALGLTEEEVMGYLDFFAEDFFPGAVDEKN